MCTSACYTIESTHSLIMYQCHATLSGMQQIGRTRSLPTQQHDLVVQMLFTTDTDALFLAIHSLASHSVFECPRASQMRQHGTHS